MHEVITKGMITYRTCISLAKTETETGNVQHVGLYKPDIVPRIDICECPHTSKMNSHGVSRLLIKKFAVVEDSTTLYSLCRRSSSPSCTHAATPNVVIHLSAKFSSRSSRVVITTIRGHRNAIQRSHDVGMNRVCRRSKSIF